MSQTSNTVNFLICDTNGQPQMVKVVQNIPKQTVAQVNSAPLKLFKVPKTEVNQQNPVYRTVNLTRVKSASKVVQVPIQTFTQLQRTAAEVEVQTVNQENTVNTEPARKVQKVLKSEIAPLTVTSSPQLSRTMASNSKNYISSVLHSTSRKRQDSENEPAPEYTTKRRKHADKVGKGLRHFSMKVCEKVRTKGLTSYNEVADELVSEFLAGMHGTPASQNYDQKNIRRRVYDALNVLMAMNIISKEKKEIQWLGLPTNSIQECTTLEKEKELKLECIQKKTQQLHELILQHILFKSLVERNRNAESKGVKPTASSAIHLPFIVVKTSEKAVINCSISNDKREYMFNFNKRFQIHDDMDVLKKMGLLLGIDNGECTEEDLQKAKRFVPKSLESYVDQIGRNASMKLSDLLNEEGSDIEGEEDPDPLGDMEEEEGGGEYSEDSGSDVDV